MTDTDLPTDLHYGKVVGRVLLAAADGLDDNRLPDKKAAAGKVRFSRQGGVTKTTGPSAFVLHEPVVCELDAEGVLVDAQKAAGVWLVTGTYRVEYMTTSTGVLSGLTAHDIVVTEAHTNSSPLDLVVAAPPGGQPLAASQFAQLVAADSALSARIDDIDPSAGGGETYDDTQIRQSVSGLINTTSGETIAFGPGRGYTAANVLATLWGTAYGMEQRVSDVETAAFTTRDRALRYTDLGSISGAVTVSGQGTVSATLTGDAPVTLTGEDGDSVLLDVDLAGHALTVEGKPVTVTPSVWVRSRGRWVTGATTGGSTDPVETPDATLPTAGTLSVAAAQTTADLSVSGALDDIALHATPFSFSKDDGATWAAWKTANTHQFQSLTPGTEYTFKHRVRDAAGNIREGAPVTRSTTAVSALTTWAADDFTTLADGADLASRITPVGEQMWQIETDNPPGSMRRSTAQGAGGKVDLNGSWQGITLRLPMTASVTERVVITADYTITAGSLGMAASGSQGGFWPAVGASLNTTGPCQVSQHTSATWTTSAATPAPPSGVATLTVTRQSSGEATMTLTVDGTTVLTASSTNAFPFGQRVGFSNGHEGRATVDNVKVEYK